MKTHINQIIENILIALLLASRALVGLSVIILLLSTIAFPILLIAYITTQYLIP